MANFPTHIAVGTVVSGTLATVTVAADMVAPENIIAVTLAGVLGSVLPDIDLKDSRPGRAMFAGLAVFFSFAVLFSLERKYSIVEMLILWLGTLVLVRYAAHSLFHRLCVHRGIWHSVAAGLFCACVTAVIYSRLLDRDEAVAWLAAGFMLVGYLTHLILDEIYSVDVMDTRIKASFGTALKLIDPRSPTASGAMVLALVASFLLSPPTRTFVDVVASPTLWSDLHHRLLPRDRWFGAMALLEQWRGKDSAGMGAVPADAGGITTGSVKSGQVSDDNSGSAQPQQNDTGQHQQR
jgi:hypothetical protein